MIFLLGFGFRHVVPAQAVDPRDVEMDSSAHGCASAPIWAEVIAVLASVFG